MEETITRPAVKTGYQYLEELKDVRNLFNTMTATSSPMSNRVCYIVDALNKIGANYKLYPFDSYGNALTGFNGAKLLNVIVEFKVPGDEPAILFLAHHDINNPRSENCQDNSASVCNLLELCGRLAATPPRRTTYIAFTDKEEFGGVGATNLSIMLNTGQLGRVQYAVNLELTGLGRALWMDSLHVGKTPLVEHMTTVFGQEITSVSTPFNDAMPMRRFGVDAICIGILPENEIHTNRATWSLCHSDRDTFEKINGEDMGHFVSNLERLI